MFRWTLNTAADAADFPGEDPGLTAGRPYRRTVPYDLDESNGLCLVIPMKKGEIIEVTEERMLEGGDREPDPR
jgi:hypothetical protein